MKPSTTRRGRAAALVAAAALVLVTACGGDDDPDSTTKPDNTPTAAAVDTATAQKTVEEASAAPSEFSAPGPAFEAAKAKGKNVWYVSYSEQSPALVVWSKNMTEALKKYGVDLTIFDGKGQQAEFQRGMQQAIADKADVIVLMGIDPASISAQVAEAKGAGIPVLVGSNGVTGIPDIDGVVGAITLDHVQVGKLLASWMVADAKEPFHAAITTHPGVMGLDPLVNSVKSTLTSLCASCQLTVESVPFTQLATLPQLAQNDIQKDPELKYILSVYDFELLSLVTGVTQAGAADKVALGSFNATQAVMEQLAAGTAIGADVGNPNAWFGYALADQILRVASGAEPVADVKVPLRLFTKESVGDVDVKAGEDTWYGDVDFVKGYADLWGAPAS